jgi:hypothetical protein
VDPGKYLSQVGLPLWLLPYSTASVGVAPYHAAINVRTSMQQTRRQGEYYHVDCSLQNAD